MRKLSPEISGMKKKNRTALVVSTNTVNALECDWSDYDMIIFPELYSMHGSMAERIRKFAAQGGTVFAMTGRKQNTDVPIDCDGRELLSDKCYKKAEAVSDFRFCLF